ncbi:hypothetical protein BE221DRAFT_61143, partial [Ostreococcus tauri]
GVAKSHGEATFYRSHTSYLTYIKTCIIPLNRSAGPWVDDFPIQRMSVLALNY